MKKDNARSIANLDAGVGTRTGEPARYLLKLIPPRPTFATDATAVERSAMAAHAEYWRGQLAAGKAVVFGPVLDPSGPWGLLVLETVDEAEMIRLKDADPVNASIPGMRWEVMPFLRAVVRPF